MVALAGAMVAVGVSVSPILFSTNDKNKGPAGAVGATVSIGIKVAVGISDWGVIVSVFSPVSGVAVGIGVSVGVEVGVGVWVGFGVAVLVSVIVITGVAVAVAFGSNVCWLNTNDSQTGPAI